MQREAHEIAHVSDTALMTAACRALETDRADGLIRDPFAARLAGDRGMAIVRALDRIEILCFGINLRSRYLDDLTGEWVSETEVIESASELIELYNPADIYAAFAEAAREAAGLPSEPTAEGDLLEVAGISPDEGVSLSEDPYAAAADSWASTQPASLSEDDDESAARRLYDLALEYQERSQRSESRLLDEFEGASAGLVSVIGDLIIVDDDDERLSLTTTGFRAEVIPEDSDEEWRTLSGAEELVEFYDPTDVFGDLADALAEAFPAVAPELADASANGTGEATEAAGDLEPAEAAADGDAEDEPTA